MDIRIYLIKNVDTDEIYYVGSGRGSIRSIGKYHKEDESRPELRKMIIENRCIVSKLMECEKCDEKTWLYYFTLKHQPIYNKIIRLRREVNDMFSKFNK